MNQLQHERERIALGDELRTLRKAKQITGIVLAEESRISQSKLSKIETGALVPSTEDLSQILSVLGAPKHDAKRLTEWARALRTEYSSWRFEHRAGFGAKQIEVAKLERQARRIRVFAASTVPGLLQIPEYAKRVMDLANITDQPDLDRAVGLRMQRQAILYEPDRQFEFLIFETAALSRFCEQRIVIRQLDRLRVLSDLPNVTIGFISGQAQLPRAPQHGFVVFDSTVAVCEMLTGEVSVTDKTDVELYNGVFEEFFAVAMFGGAADSFLDRCRLLINRPSGKDVARPASDRSELLARR